MLRVGTHKAPQGETLACVTPRREIFAPPVAIHEAVERAVSRFVVVTQNNRQTVSAAVTQSKPDECNQLHWSLLGAAVGGSIAAVPALLVAKRFNNEGGNGRAVAGTIIGLGAVLGGVMGLGKCLP